MIDEASSTDFGSSREERKDIARSRLLCRIAKESFGQSNKLNLFDRLKFKLGKTG